MKYVKNLYTLNNTEVSKKKKISKKFQMKIMFLRDIHIQMMKIKIIN